MMMIMGRRKLVRKMQESMRKCVFVLFLSLETKRKRVKQWRQQTSKNPNSPSNLGLGLAQHGWAQTKLFFFSKIRTARYARRLGATRPHLCQEGVLELTKRATRANGCDARYTRNSRKTALFQHAQKYR